MESLAIVASVILFFGIFGGLIAMGLLKISPKNTSVRLPLTVITFLISIFSLVMAFSIAISSVAIVIRLMGAAGFGTAIFALMKIFRGERFQRR